MVRRERSHERVRRVVIRVRVRVRRIRVRVRFGPNDGARRVFRRRRGLYTPRRRREQFSGVHGHAREGDVAASVGLGVEGDDDLVGDVASVERHRERLRGAVEVQPIRRRRPRAGHLEEPQAGLDAREEFPAAHRRVPKGVEPHDELLPAQARVHERGEGRVRGIRGIRGGGIASRRVRRRGGIRGIIR